MRCDTAAGKQVQSPVTQHSASFPHPFPPGITITHHVERRAEWWNKHLSHPSSADKHNTKLIKSLHHHFYNICIHKSAGGAVNGLYTLIYYSPSCLKTSIWIWGSKHQQHKSKRKNVKHTYNHWTCSDFERLLWITLLYAFKAAGRQTFVKPRHKTDCLSSILTTHHYFPDCYCM